MSKMKPLTYCAKFVSEKIRSIDLNLDQYVTTDNLLQNKKGIVKADSLPANPSNVTRYVVGDILLANIRPYLKKIWYANICGGCSADVLAFRAKSGMNPKFLYYALFRNDFFDHVMRGSKGTKMPRGDKNQIMEFLVPDYALKTQQKIAALLSALDAKIECNNRINAELEAMAKTLYDYWFVQFNFPDQNGQPYKNSGGKMVYNSTLKRKIPAGWDICNLSDIICRSGTGLNPRDNFKLGSGDNYYVTIKNINNGKIILDEKCDKIDDEALAIIDQRSQLQPGDILFTSIEPVGVTYLIHEKPINWNINESVFTLRPDYNVMTSEFLYLLLSSSEMKAFTKNVSSGSVHKGIRHGVLKTFKLPCDSKSIIDDFSKIIKPILRKIFVLDCENQHLAQLRDWLLPMLMNGQVTVE